MQGGFPGAAPEEPKGRAALAAATKAAKAAATKAPMTKAPIVAKAGKAAVEPIQIRHAEVQVKMPVPASEEPSEEASEERPGAASDVEPVAAAAAVAATATLARAAVDTATKPTSTFLIGAEPTSSSAV